MKFNIIHIIICIFVFVGCTQQTVNNSVECFTIKESGSSLVYCSDTLKSKIQMEIIKGHYTVETKEVFAIVSNPKHLSLGYDSAWNLEKWENSQWIILDKKKHTNYFAEWHYKIFCVNGNTGFRNESRIFYFIHLQNEEAYERKESSSA